MDRTQDPYTPSPITLSLIVAIADNGVIGRGNALPWRLGSDLKRFRKLTMGHPLIMGRHTFESIGKPLDGRDSIVVTHGQPLAEGEGLYFVPSLEEAIRLGEARARARGVLEVFIIGGARLFEHALPLARRSYLTRVHGSPEGDVYWNPQFGGEWTEISREEQTAGVKDEFAVTNFVLERPGD
jgi:dihydrofolate reductase